MQFLQRRPLRRALAAPLAPSGRLEPLRGLVVHRAAKYADLSLKGKFFKRYDVVAPVGAAEGNYETPAKLRAFLAEKRISLSPEDRAELETLLPAKTPVLVSEL